MSDAKNNFQREIRFTLIVPITVQYTLVFYFHSTKKKKKKGKRAFVKYYANTERSVEKTAMFGKYELPVVIEILIVS